MIDPPVAPFAQFVEVVRGTSAPAVSGADGLKTLELTRAVSDAGLAIAA